MAEECAYREGKNLAISDNQSNPGSNPSSTFSWLCDFDPGVCLSDCQFSHLYSRANTID